MKRKKNTLLGVVICAFSVILLLLQWQNVESMVRMRASQFDKSVKRSLIMAVHDYELEETSNYLKTEIQERKQELDSMNVQHITMATGDSALAGEKAELRVRDIVFQPETLASAVPLKMQTSLSDDSDLIFAKNVRDAITYQNSILDEVINTMVFNVNVSDLSKRLKPNSLSAKLSRALLRNEIDSIFHYRVVADDGKEVFRCKCYNPEGCDHVYEQRLFSSAFPGKGGVLYVHFPQRNAYLWGAAKTIWPTIVFTVLLFGLFWLAIYHLSQQRKGTEMKNDFINNMTHEFKTPLASISLAAQMLNDKSVTKTEKMYDNLATIISNESRRMRFQVEKVLQMSLFDHNNIRLKTEELDTNAMLESVINTFQLRVKQSGGTIETKIEAYDPFVYGDEMHLTNVFFNLLDNAVKYAKPEDDLHLLIHTENVGDNVQITIQDNGIGIQKSDLSHIFERFYRVHTGNKHNVKGFGLGLAYVHTIIGLHHGKIKAESELGQGTRFIINLPKVSD